jgi:hypothetical protein
MDHTDLVNLLARAGFNVNLAGQAGVKIRGPQREEVKHTCG